MPKVETAARVPLAPRLAVLAIGVVALGLATSNPYFLRPDNLQNLARNTAFFLIFALAQMHPILVRGLDLSQGGLVALVSVAAATLAGAVGSWQAFAACAVVGLAVGMLQGVLVGWAGLSAFVVTLGVGSVLSGVALLISNGQTIYKVPDDFRMLGWTDVMSLPMVSIAAVVCLAGVAFLLRRTTLGRLIYATGSNPKAALGIGIPTVRVMIICYVISAVLTTIGALFLSSRITSGSPVVGGEIALQSIAAVVVGGVSLFGGRGSALGVLMGALTLAVLANLLNLYNVSSYWQSVLFGAVIIAAVGLDRLQPTR